MRHKRVGHFSRCMKHYFVLVRQGHWMKTHVCVALVRCPEETCGAKRDEPCKSGREPFLPMADTHYLRRERWKAGAVDE